MDWNADPEVLSQCRYCWGIVEVGQKLSLCDNDHSCPLGHRFPEDDLHEAHLLFCREGG